VIMSGAGTGVMIHTLARLRNTRAASDRTGTRG
jgi:hypothetical protein